ncbi:MAG: Xaa-Pro peptidase family protein [Alphaproteobacteria bacterium]
MQTYLREQVDWPQPFPPEEYAARRARVRKAMAERKIDAIYVTIPADLTWLTGYDMIWYHLRNLTGLLVRADRDDTVFFDGAAHVTIVSTTPAIPEATWFQRGDVADHIKLIAKEIAARGLGKGHVALQPWSHSPHATVMDALAKALGDGGAAIADGNQLVEELRLVKSAREIEVMRRAASIADEAMAAARDAIAPGVMETELEAVIMGSLMRNGGGYPGIRSMIGSGPRAGTHHGPAQHRKIKRGDLVFVDFCGSLHRYHVNVNRTFSLGEPDKRWVDLMNKSAGCIDAIVREVKPGDPWSKAAKVGERQIDEVGLRKYVWWVGGYNQGIALPPDWCGTFWVEPRAGTPDRPLVPGMFFNFENQFDVWENWPGGSGCAYIDTLEMTNAGLKVMSKLPRTLVVV